MKSNFKIENFSSDISSEFFSQQNFPLDILYSIFNDLRSIYFYKNELNKNIESIVIIDKDLKDLASIYFKSPDIFRSSSAILVFVGDSKLVCPSFLMGYLCSKLDSNNLLFFSEDSMNENPLNIDSLKKLLKIPMDKDFLVAIATGLAINPTELDKKNIEIDNVFLNIYKTSCFKTVP